MATFTSSLPDDLLDQLGKAAKEMKLPKNKLIEKALTMYFEKIEKVKYIQSYKRMANDPEMNKFAEEDLEYWFNELDKLEDEAR
ncbi:MAG: ribbon-helix-helix domain-containing protein [Nonlabens sp.]